MEELELDRRAGKGRRCCLGDVLECRTMAFSCKDDLKKSLCKNILFGGVVVWCGVNQMIIHFPKSSILPSALRHGIESFCPPTSSDNLCLLFCLILLLYWGEVIPMTATQYREERNNIQGNILKILSNLCSGNL